MDLQQKIQARKLERKQEALERQKAEKLREEQKQRELERERQLEVKKAQEFLNSNPIPDEKNVGQPDEPAGLNQQVNAQELVKETEEIDIDAEREAAEKIIDDEAAKRIGTIPSIGIVCLLGYGIFDLFVSGWVGLIWIAIAFGIAAFFHDQERKKLLNGSE